MLVIMAVAVVIQWWCGRLWGWTRGWNGGAVIVVVMVVVVVLVRHASKQTHPVHLVQDAVEVVEL